MRGHRDNSNVALKVTVWSPNTSSCIAQMAVAITHALECEIHASTIFLIIFIFIKLLNCLSVNLIETKKLC